MGTTCQSEFLPYYCHILVAGSGLSCQHGETPAKHKQTRSSSRYERQNSSRMRVLFICGLCCLVFVVDHGSSSGPSEQQYCPYFQNRKPERQENLKNCTWYKDNACCSAAEVDFSFSQLTSLPGADDKCQRHLNYLYCYICAPNQNSFFSTNTLTVCEEFCDDLFRACRDAVLKGRRIGESYSSGKEFCKSRRFKVDKEASGKCFTFDGNHSSSGGEARRHQTQACLFLLLIALFAQCVMVL